MKYLICLLLFASCQIGGSPVITYKTPADQPGMCHYRYIGLDEAGNISFTDSCTLYHIGDTIRGRVRP